MGPSCYIEYHGIGNPTIKGFCCISETAGWIFSIQSSMELSRPEVVHHHDHLPHMGLLVGQKLVKSDTTGVQTLRNAYL